MEIKEINQLVAENNLPFLVLDRPNPLGGEYIVEGELLERTCDEGSSCLEEWKLVMKRYWQNKIVTNKFLYDKKWGQILVEQKFYEKKKALYKL